MDFYIYRADVYCDDCGVALRAGLRFQAPEQPENGRTYDSDDYPKGPYGPEESDCPQHCGRCQVFLKNPLTSDGYRYLVETLRSIQWGEWLDYYGDDFVDGKRVREWVAELAYR